MVYTNLARSNKHHQPAVWRSRRDCYLLLLMALVCSAAWPAAAAPDAPARVRSTNATMLELIKEGTERSAMFRTLVDAIDHSNGIVYVEPGICAFGHLNGCVLPFIFPIQGQRYMRILVTPDKSRVSHDQRLALIAHELQHAREVIAHAEVVDVPTMDQMYRQIGTPLPGTLSGYETSEARAAGDAVFLELSAKAGIPLRKGANPR